MMWWPQWPVEQRPHLNPSPSRRLAKLTAGPWPRDLPTR